MTSETITISGKEQEINFENPNNIPHIISLQDLSLKIGTILDTDDLSIVKYADDLSIVKYADSKYVLKYKGEEIGWCSTDEFNQMKDALYEKSITDVIIQYTHVQASILQDDVEHNPSAPRTLEEENYVLAHLGTYKLETLLGMYNTKQFPSEKRKKLLDAIQAKFAQQTNGDQLIFLENLDKTNIDERLLYALIITIIRNIPSDDKVDSIFDKIEKDKIKEAIMNFSIDHDFSKTFFYNYNSEPKHRGYSSEVFRNGELASEQDQEAGDILVAYVMSMESHGGVKNISSTSRAIYQAFGSDLITFKKDFLPAVEDHKRWFDDSKGVLGRHGLIGGLGVYMDKALSSTNMSESQKSFRKGTTSLALGIAAIYAIFRAVKGAGRKGMLGLLGAGFAGEFILNATRGESIFERGNKILFGSGGGLAVSDSVRKSFNSSREIAGNDSKLKEKIGNAHFANIFIGDEKLKDLEKYLDFSNNEHKFKAKEYIDSLEDGDRRKEFLGNMGEDAVSRVFSKAFTEAGITSDSKFNENKDEKFSTVYSQALERRRRENLSGRYMMNGHGTGSKVAATTGATIPGIVSMRPDSNVPSSWNLADALNSDSGSSTDTDGQANTAEEAEPLTEGELLMARDSTYEIIGRENGVISFRRENGEIVNFKIPEGIDKMRQFLTVEGKQRFSALSDVIGVWSYNCARKAENSMFKLKSTKDSMRAAATKVQDILSEAKNKDFDDKEKYEELLNKLFNLILGIEKDNTGIVGDGIIGDDEMSDIKELLLDISSSNGPSKYWDGTAGDSEKIYLREFSKSEGEYGANLRKIYELLRKGDTQIVREKLADKMVNTPEFDFFLKIEEKIYNQSKIMHQEDARTILLESMTLDVLAKATGLNPESDRQKLEDLQKQIIEKSKKLIGKINEKVQGSDGEKALNSTFDQLDDNQKKNIGFITRKKENNHTQDSEELFASYLKHVENNEGELRRLALEERRKMQINLTFSRKLKHLILRDCLAASEIRGFPHLSYRGQYADVVGLAKVGGGVMGLIHDIKSIDDGNKSIAIELGLTAATCLIPGGLLFAGARIGLTATRLGVYAARTGLLARASQGAIFFGSTSAAFIGTELLPSISESMGEAGLVRTGSKQEYIEFLAISTILAGYAPVKRALSGGARTFSIRNFSAHAISLFGFSEVSINTMRLLQDKEIELSPGNWDQEDIMIVGMIALMHFAGNKGNKLGSNKISASKSVNGNIQVNFGSTPSKVKFSTRAGTLKTASWNFGSSSGSSNWRYLAGKGEHATTRILKDSSGKSIIQRRTYNPSTGSETLQIRSGGKTRTYNIQEFNPSTGTYKYTVDGFIYEVKVTGTTTELTVSKVGSTTTKFTHNGKGPIDPAIRDFRQMFRMRHAHVVANRLYIGGIRNSIGPALDSNLKNSLSTELKGSTTPVKISENLSVKMDSKRFELSNSKTGKSKVFDSIDDLLDSLSLSNRQKLAYVRESQTRLLNQYVTGKRFMVGSNEYQITINNKGNYQFQKYDGSNFVDVEYRKIPKVDRKALHAQFFAKGTGGGNILRGGYINRPGFVKENGKILNIIVNNDVLNLKNSLAGKTNTERIKSLAWFIASGNPQGFSGGTMSRGATLLGIGLMPGMTLTEVVSDMVNDDVKSWDTYLKSYSMDMGVYGVLNRAIGTLYIMEELGILNNYNINAVFELANMQDVLPNKETIDLIIEQTDSETLGRYLRRIQQSEFVDGGTI